MVSANTTSQISVPRAWGAGSYLCPWPTQGHSAQGHDTKESPMNTTVATISPARHARVRRLVGMTLFTAVLALAASPFGQLAIARADFSQDSFDWCMNNLSEGVDYCCEHAGGVVRTGACVDPATLRIQGGGGATVQPTRHPLPIVTGPPATAVNPGNAG